MVSPRHLGNKKYYNGLLGKVENLAGTSINLY
jgi:hypothetical protein